MKRLTDTALAVGPDYRQFIEALKARVVNARVTAARRVNQELILLYWDIGRAIVEKQQTLGWGESVVEQVAKDLQAAFPRKMCGGCCSFTVRTPLLNFSHSL
jgi:hypothetical protein